jgi:hypothetical protein
VTDFPCCDPADSGALGVPQEPRDEMKIGDALADGKITAHDADVIRRFSEFLTKAGPMPPYGCKPGDKKWLAWRDSLTDAQRSFTDPEWREFLGLPTLEESDAY